MSVEDASLLSLSASRGSNGFFKLPRWKPRAAAQLGASAGASDAGAAAAALSASAASADGGRASVAAVDVQGLTAAALAAAAAVHPSGGLAPDVPPGSTCMPACPSMGSDVCNMASFVSSSGARAEWRQQGKPPSSALGSWPEAVPGGAHGYPDAGRASPQPRLPGMGHSSSSSADAGGAGMTASQQDLAQRLATFAAAARLGDLHSAGGVAPTAGGGAPFYPTVMSDSICNLGDVPVSMSDSPPERTPQQQQQQQAGGRAPSLAAPQPVLMSQSRLPPPSQQRQASRQQRAANSDGRKPGRAVLAVGGLDSVASDRSDCSSPGRDSPSAGCRRAAGKTFTVTPGGNIMEAAGFPARTAEGGADRQPPADRQQHQQAAAVQTSQAAPGSGWLW
jgi:hypothetical protein